MLPLFEEYQNRLHTMLREIEQALDGLPQAAIDWSPGPEINSIGVLVAHVSGSTTYWIGDVVGRGTTQRVRATEFRTAGVTAGELLQGLTAVRADADATLASLTLDDLNTLRRAPTDGQEYTVAWSLLHALEHAALHAGQIQLTRQWWLQQQGTGSS
jgi:uncharacterized damage-inducible protein DinB